MPSLFLSHSHSDKAFARRLGEVLKRHGIRVWVDEWEIKVGESLIQKISEGIQECEYLGVVLSPESVGSEWVQRELNIALTHEIVARKVKVLPLLYRDCRIPAFLIDKFYADFTLSFDAGLVSLLRTLGTDVGPILAGAPSAEPFVKEFSENDWQPHCEGQLQLTIEYSSHKKKTPIAHVQSRTKQGWQEPIVDIYTVNENDVQVIALSRFAGRVIVK